MKNSLRFPFLVKVCGVTNYEDARAALEAGANALGFNFYSQSSRFIPLEEAAEVISRLKGDFLRVGVFVHPTPEIVGSAASLLDVAQIHGSGNAPLPIWRAVSAETAPAMEESVVAWLLDSFTPAFGGSGNTFDWSLAAAFPYRCIVAGGLDSGNVTEAIRVANPWGVDSCSRLESAPGRKDHKRVAAFVEKAIEAFRARQAINI